jgi:hypothetical protein
MDIGTLSVLEGELPGRALAWSKNGRQYIKRSWPKIGGFAARRRSRGRSGPWFKSIFAMYWDIVEVKPEPDYCLFIRFQDGLSGRVHLQQSELTGVLTPLKDPGFFEQVFIDEGAIAWPGEIDLAPDAMHAEIARQRHELSADMLQSQG